MNYDTDSCALQREFGEENQRVYFELRSFGPKSETQVIVASADLDLSGNEVRYSFEPADTDLIDVSSFGVNFANGYRGKLFSNSLNPIVEELSEASWEFIERSPTLTTEQRELLLQTRGLDPESGAYARLANHPEFMRAVRIARSMFLDSTEYEQLRNNREQRTNSFFVSGVFKEDVALEAGSLQQPMEAMRTCLDELLTHWGVDAYAHKSLTREALPRNFRRFASEIQDSYPYTMLRQGMQGYLRTRLDISAEGDVTGCRVQNRFTDEAFEDKACGNLTRIAKFDPALDASGQPIASYYLISIMYRIGSD